VCKLDGETRSAPPAVAAHDDSGRPVWQKLMVHASELARVDGHPLHRALMARLWQGGASGVTVLRGVRGFYAGGQVLSDRVVSLQRDVPVHVILVERPDRVQALWPLIDELTAGAGMVTSELVPAAGQRWWKNPPLQAL
jgi:PII-like signaling protein